MPVVRENKKMTLEFILPPFSGIVRPFIFVKPLEITKIKRKIESSGSLAIHGVLY